MGIDCDETKDCGAGRETGGVKVGKGGLGVVEVAPGVIL